MHDPRSGGGHERRKCQGLGSTEYGIYNFGTFIIPVQFFFEIHGVHGVASVDFRRDTIAVWCQNSIVRRFISVCCCCTCTETRSPCHSSAFWLSRVAWKASVTSKPSFGNLDPHVGDVGAESSMVFSGFFQLRATLLKCDQRTATLNSSSHPLKSDQLLGRLNFKPGSLTAEHLGLRTKAKGICGFRMWSGRKSYPWHKWLYHCAPKTPYRAGPKEDAAGNLSLLAVLS